MEGTLPLEPWCIGGPVIKGFGRGSKVLGIPTGMRSSLFLLLNGQYKCLTRYLCSLEMTVRISQKFVIGISVSCEPVISEILIFKSNCYLDSNSNCWRGMED